MFGFVLKICPAFHDFLIFFSLSSARLYTIWKVVISNLEFGYTRNLEKRERDYIILRNNSHMVDSSTNKIQIVLKTKFKHTKNKITIIIFNVTVNFPIIFSIIFIVFMLFIYSWIVWNFFAIFFFRTAYNGEVEVEIKFKLATLGYHNGYQ